MHIENPMPTEAEVNMELVLLTLICHRLEREDLTLANYFDEVGMAW